MTKKRRKRHTPEQIVGSCGVSTGSVPTVSVVVSVIMITLLQKVCDDVQRSSGVPRPQQSALLQIAPLLVARRFFLSRFRPGRIGKLWRCEE